MLRYDGLGGAGARHRDSSCLSIRFFRSYLIVRRERASPVKRSIGAIWKLEGSFAGGRSEPRQKFSQICRLVPEETPMKAKPIHANISTRGARELDIIVFSF